MAKPMTTLTPEQLESLARMAGQGLNLSQMAAIIGISDRTMDRLVERDPAVKGAIEKGRADASNEVTRTAYRMAVSGRVPAMTMFWLKCRERWTEVQRFEHTGANGQAIEHKDVTQMPELELDARINEFISKWRK